MHLFSFKAIDCASVERVRMLLFIGLYIQSGVRISNAKVFAMEISHIISSVTFVSPFNDLKQYVR